MIEAKKGRRANAAAKIDRRRGVDDRLLPGRPPLGRPENHVVLGLRRALSGPRRGFSTPLFSCTRFMIRYRHHGYPHLVMYAVRRRRQYAVQFLQTFRRIIAGH